MTPDYILFPDASAIPENDDRDFTYRGGYACVILNPKNGNFTVVHKPSRKGNSYHLEIKAVKYGLQELCNVHTGYPLKVLVVSDCLAVVTTMNHLITYKGSKRGRWLTKRGNRIKFYEEYKKIYRIIKQYHLHIRFVHILSHGYNNNEINRSIQRKIRKNFRSHYIFSTTDLSYVFMQMNRIADLYAKSELSKFQEKYRQSTL